MITKSIKLIKQLIFENGKGKYDSKAVTDPTVLRKFYDDPDFPFLISFPRTGSHWLRMIMELYFERPSLVRIFYYPGKTNYLTLHTHDMGLDIYRKNVIYLYRDPLPTIYSQMMYEKEDINDIKRIRHWTSLYGRHLQKWLFEEQVSVVKTIIRYENMLEDLPKEFSKVTDHLGMQLDSEKLKVVSAQITKDKVKKKTVHDQQVINITRHYSEEKKEFVKRNSETILSILFEVAPKLQDFFDD